MTWSRRPALIARLLPLLAICVLCVSCSDFWVSNSSTAGVTVTPASEILKVAAADGTGGDTATLAASAKTVGGTSTDETSAAVWTSSAPAVVTVSAGKLTVVGTTADSTAVITATFGGQNATCSVLTYTGTAPTALNSIVIPSGVSTGSLTPGQTFQLEISANISGNSTRDVTPYVTWVSSNTSAATVSTTGAVSVLSTATAGAQFTITATANFAGSSVSSPALQFSVINGAL
jgi:hypothetical protein